MEMFVNKVVFRVRTQNMSGWFVPNAVIGAGYAAGDGGVSNLTLYL